VRSALDEIRDRIKELRGEYIKTRADLAEIRKEL